MDTASRYIFIVINVILMALGLLLLGFSIWLQYSSPIHEILVVDHSSRVVIYGVLILGCFSLLFGLFGVLGGVFKRKWLLAIYLSVNIGIFIVVLAILIYGVTNQDVVKNQTTAIWASLDDNVKFVVQGRFNCCGFHNASEWNGVYDTSCLNTSVTTSTTIPWSIGCLSSILSWIEENAVGFGAAVGLLFFFLVFQIGLTTFLILRLNKSKKSSTNKELWLGSLIGQQDDISVKSSQNGKQ